MRIMLLMVMVSTMSHWILYTMMAGTMPHPKIERKRTT